MTVKRDSVIRVASRHMKKEAFMTGVILTQSDAEKTMRNIISWVMDDYGKQMQKVFLKTFGSYHSENLAKEFREFLKEYIRDKKRISVFGYDVEIAKNIPTMFIEFLSKEYGPAQHKKKMLKIVKKNHKKIVDDIWNQVATSVAKNRREIEKNYAMSQFRIEEKDRLRAEKEKARQERERLKEIARVERERELSEIADRFRGVGEGYSMARVAFWKGLFVTVTGGAKVLNDKNFLEAVQNSMASANKQLDSHISKLSCPDVDLILKALKKIKKSEVQNIAKRFFLPWISQAVPRELVVKKVDKKKLNELIMKKRLL